jgi:hypothetical protein
MGTGHSSRGFSTQAEISRSKCSPPQLGQENGVASRWKLASFEANFYLLASGRTQELD